MCAVLFELEPTNVVHRSDCTVASRRARLVRPSRTRSGYDVAQLEAKRLMVRSYSSLHLHSEKFPQAVEVGVTATFKKNQV